MSIQHKSIPEDQLHETSKVLLLLLLINYLEQRETVLLLISGPLILLRVSKVFGITKIRLPVQPLLH